MKTLFKSLIVLHVEYCSELWMPIEPTQIQTIEKLQKYFLQNNPEIRYLDNWEHLKHMKMLQSRLERL